MVYVFVCIPKIQLWVNFMVILTFIWPFGLFHHHLVYWAYIFFRFGMRHQEKSGSPVSRHFLVCMLLHTWATLGNAIVKQQFNIFSQLLSRRFSIFPPFFPAKRKQMVFF
jgi:hypothetical protein